jgi:hypothetical protein
VEAPLTAAYIYLDLHFNEDEIPGPFEKFVDWRQHSAVMHTEAVTVMLSCSCGDNVVVA